VAKNDETHLGLSRQFADRLTGKVYLAILHGLVGLESGEIRAAIARHPAHRKRMAVAEGRGRAAHTSYRVARRLAAVTLVEAVLRTGRTHQLRVHFQHLGFPVVGDDLYAKRPNIRLAESTGYTAPRQMLHAWKLSFEHPRAGRRMEFEAPIPGDFAQALHILEAGPASPKKSSLV
jgi:23S rRNA pseudouridine1911/1915/1917 synthase